MSLSVAGYFLDTVIVAKFIISCRNSSCKVPTNPYWKVVLLCSSDVLPPAAATQWFMATIPYTKSNSSLDRTHKAMTSAGFTVPYLPLCPSPHQDTRFGSLHFWPRGRLSPVGVADWLAACPLPASSAFPVIQTLYSWRINGLLE